MMISPAKDYFVIYEINMGDYCVYRGYCRLNEFENLSDAHRSDEFRNLKTYIPKGETKPIMMEKGEIKILDIYPDSCDQSELECWNIVFDRKRSVPQIKFTKSTRSGRRSDARKIPVYCVELEMKFDSSTQAARDLNIHQPNLIRHLNSGKGTVGGYTFRRIE